MYNNNVVKVKLIMFFVIWIFFLGFVDPFYNTSSDLCFHHERYVSKICNTDARNLSCSEDHVIRIKDIHIKNKTTDRNNSCNECPSSPDDDDQWENVTDSVYFETLLYRACSGKSACNFALDDIVHSFEIYESIWTASIQYECVAKDLFKEFCSTWEQITNTVHIFLNRTGDVPNECLCIIEGDMNKTGIEIVDYRHYINDILCANTSIVVNGKNWQQCVQDGTGFSVYNENIQVANNVTNITILFTDNFPDMIWIHVTGTNVTVQCNDSIHHTYSPSLSSSMSTVNYVTTATMISSSDTETVPKETATQGKNTNTTLKKDDADKNIFTTPVIAGGSAGIATVVVIIVIICISCRRKSNRMTNKMYTVKESNNQSNAENTSEIGKNVNSKIYETGLEMVDTKVKKDSNYEEIWAMEDKKDDEGDIGEYVDPADVINDGISEHETKIQTPISTARHNSEGNNYTEPYNNTVISKDKESQNNYTKVIKLKPKTGAYDTCTGNDNYSHIKAGTQKKKPKSLDNYSHIHFTGNEHKPSRSNNYSHTKLKQKDDSRSDDNTDVYNHIHIDNESQTADADKSINEEDEEYDHLVNFSHH